MFWSYLSKGIRMTMGSANLKDVQRIFEEHKRTWHSSFIEQYKDDINAIQKAIDSYSFRMADMKDDEAAKIKNDIYNLNIKYKKPQNTTMNSFASVNEAAKIQDSYNTYNTNNAMPNNNTHASNMNAFSSNIDDAPSFGGFTDAPSTNAFNVATPDTNTFNTAPQQNAFTSNTNNTNAFTSNDMPNFDNNTSSASVTNASTSANAATMPNTVDASNTNTTDVNSNNT